MAFHPSNSAFLAWTNNLSDYDDGEYSDVEEEESDEEFNQKSEGNEHSQIHIFVSLFFFSFLPFVV